MAEKKAYIYKITNPNSKIYIGQTTNLKSRIKGYKVMKGRGQKIINSSIVKYGWDAHKFEIIVELDTWTPELLHDLEKHYIRLYNTYHKWNKNGMNLTIGGDGLGYGEFHPHYGKPRSEETKKKLSEANKGFVVPEETKKKISDTWKKKFENGYVSKSIGFKHSEETKKKWSESKKGKPKSEEFKLKQRNRKATEETISKRKATRNTDEFKMNNYKIILDTITGVFYLGIPEASCAYNISRSHISAMLSGKVFNKTNLIYT